MRQYFTYVNPYWDNAWHPIEYAVEKNLGSLWPLIEANFCVISGASVEDMRQLGYIELTVDENGDTPVPLYPTGKYNAEAVMDMILSLFVHTKESVEEAKEKVERWSGRTDITIDGDKVVIPEINPENQ